MDGGAAQSRLRASVIGSPHEKRSPATFLTSYALTLRGLQPSCRPRIAFTMASTLLGSIDHRLPNELTLAVVQQLAHDKRTLCTLAQTCRGFQQLAEEHIYKTIKLRSVRDLQRIISAFVARHDRVRAVHTLKILYRYNEHLDVSLERRKAFNECVAQMVNLREWHIESPYDNFKWEKGGHEWVEGDMERFRQALEKACVDGAEEKARFAQDQSLWNSLQRTVGLAQLQSLTIHSHGARADFWDLDGYHCLFRHPSLRYLHVSCVTFPETLDVLDPHKRSTPLTTLILDECNLEPGSLRQILFTPEKLKYLTLGENIFNINRSAELAPRLSPNPLAALEAIAPVAHSLESLTHLDSKWRLDPDNPSMARRRITGDGMRNFRSLKTMECDTGSFLHEAVVMNHEFCPPNLDTLIVRRHFYVAEDFFDYLPDVGIYTELPSLNTLELRQSAASLSRLATAEYICHPERLRNRHAYAYTLFKHSINFKVSIELGRGSSLIPPYLHGEPVPKVRCLYDASQTGFRRRMEPDPSEAVYDTPVTFPGHIVTPFHPFRADNIPAVPLNTSSSTREILDTSPTANDNDDDLPETDQLPQTAIRQITNSTHRTLEHMRSRFNRSRDRRLNPLLDPTAALATAHPDLSSSSSHSSSDISDDDDDDDIDGADDFSGEETDSDFEAMLADLQNDGDEAQLIAFLAQLQEQGVQVVMGSEDEEEEGDDDGDGSWHDADEVLGLDDDGDGEDEWEDAEDDLD